MCSDCLAVTEGRETPSLRITLSMTNKAVLVGRKVTLKVKQCMDPSSGLIGNRWVEPIAVNIRPVDVRCQSSDVAEVNPWCLTDARLSLW